MWLLGVGPGPSGRAASTPNLWVRIKLPFRLNPIEANVQRNSQTYNKYQPFPTRNSQMGRRCLRSLCLRKLWGERRIKISSLSLSRWQSSKGFFSALLTHTADMEHSRRPAPASYLYLLSRRDSWGSTIQMSHITPGLPLLLMQSFSEVALRDQSQRGCRIRASKHFLV